MTASEEHTPERRQDERRQVAQPAFYGENRNAVRRADDVDAVDAVDETEVQQYAEPVMPGATPRQDYEFLTGLISMEHSG